MAFPLTDEEHLVIKSRIDSQEELIVAAAIKTVYNGREYIVFRERPGRHGEVINFLHVLGLPYGSPDQEGEQGFVTNRGRFVDRTEAGRIVQTSGQTTTRSHCNDNLFSEDIWNDTDNFNARANRIRADEIF